MNSYELLTRAHNLIASTDLAKGFYARSATNERVMPWNPEAVSFCMQGAIIFVVLESEKALDGEEEPRNPVMKKDRADASKALREAAGAPYLPTWNDAPERTKQEVLDALTLAAENEKKRLDMA